MRREGLGVPQVHRCGEEETGRRVLMLTEPSSPAFSLHHS